MSMSPVVGATTLLEVVTAAACLQIFFNLVMLRLMMMVVKVETLGQKSATL